LHLDDTYQQQMEELVERVIGLAQEVNPAAASAR